ncbi:MAG TPA: response regulator, partial [Clostridia bacterium]
MFRLLVVEDEEMIRNKILNNTNWKENGFIEVFEAQDGYDALEIIKRNKIDIVITDIQMPKMNGIELVREIRKIDKRIRIVIITAYAEFEYAKESITLNVNDYILKPFKSKDLLMAVKKVMEGIVRESNERLEIETLRKQLRENRKALQDKLFNDLLSNSYVGNIDNDLSYLELSNLKGKEYFTAVVNISNFMDIIHENDEEQKYICNLTLFNWINKFLSGFVMEQELHIDYSFGYQVINYKIDQIVIVFYSDPNIAGPVLEELIERGNRDLGFNLTVGTGNKYQNMKDMHISYKEACSAAMLSSIHGKWIVYNYNDIIPGDKVHSKQLHIPVDTRLYDDLKIGAFTE